jgi:hypothetical protein
MGAVIIGYIKNVYQSFKHKPTDNKNTYEKKVDEKNYWQKEWRKAYSPINAEKE